MDEQMGGEFRVTGVLRSLQQKSIQGRDGQPYNFLEAIVFQPSQGKRDEKVWTITIPDQVPPPDPIPQPNDVIRISGYMNGKMKYGPNGSWTTHSLRAAQIENLGPYKAQPTQSTWGAIRAPQKPPMATPTPAGPWGKPVSPPVPSEEATPEDGMPF